MGNKMKPRKAATKRIKVNAKGTMSHRKAGLTHLQSKRSSRTQIRNNDGAQAIAPSDIRAAKALLGKSRK